MTPDSCVSTLMSCNSISSLPSLMRQCKPVYKTSPLTYIEETSLMVCVGLFYSLIWHWWWYRSRFYIFVSHDLMWQPPNHSQWIVRPFQVVVGQHRPIDWKGSPGNSLHSWLKVCCVFVWWSSNCIRGAYNFLMGCWYVSGVPIIYFWGDYNSYTMTEVT